MNERDKVLLQREAIKRFVTDDDRFIWDGMSDLRLRRLFPLPPEKVPNEQRARDILYRQNPETGRLETKHSPVSNKYVASWDYSWTPVPEDQEAAIRAVIAEPYRLVSGEDAE